MILNDVVLIVEDENGMRLMLHEFAGYVREKDSCVNVEKTKLVRFRNKRVGEG